MGLLDKVSIFSSTTPKFDQGKAEWGSGFSAVQQEMLLADTMTADNTNFSTTGEKFGKPKDLTIGIKTNTSVPDLDLNTTFAVGDDPGLGDVKIFDLGYNSTLQQDSLFELGVAYGNDNWEAGESYYQDLNGINPSELGIGFDLGMESTLHEDLLTQQYIHSHLWSPQTFYKVDPGTLDLNGQDVGNGLFGAADKPGKGQGLQVGGQDLHVHLLTGEYNYLHGTTVPWISPGSVGPSPGKTGNSEFQDLNATFTGLGDTPIFNFGKEPPQDPSNPIYDTIHESYLQPNPQPGFEGEDPKYLHLQGQTGFFQGAKDVRDSANRNSLNAVPITPSQYADLNNSDVNTIPPFGAPTPNDKFFYQDDGIGINRPAIKQGYKLNGEDLHVSLLSNPYTYTHGQSTTTIAAAASSQQNYNFQDLDIDIASTTPPQYVEQMHNDINQYIAGGMTGLGNTNY
tara:strand:+ start:3400 stop:4761 length:1362 start_codon:yes stop_codon:yes gene_type:complete